MESMEPDDSDEFHYVVEKVVPARVCFGSGLSRDTNPIGKGLSPYQRRFANEIHTKITPQTYHNENLTSGVARLSNKVRSNKGVGGLANGGPRMPHPRRGQAPSPTKYDPEPVTRTFKQSRAPFGKALPKIGRKRFEAPGVGLYDIRTKQGLRTKMQNNFGRPKMEPTVEVVCTPTPPHECYRCGATCNNDYWHKNHDIFLCHICMEEEKMYHEDYTQAQLKEFEKIRICTYKHNHAGVEAAELILPPKTLAKRERLENYLTLYISSL